MDQVHEVVDTIVAAQEALTEVRARGEGHLGEDS